MFRAMLENTPDMYPKTSLYTLKFCLLAHFVEYVDRFGYLKLLGSSDFEPFSVHVSPAYGSASLRRTSVFEETLPPVDIITHIRRQEPPKKTNGHETCGLLNTSSNLHYMSV